jgi:membrane protein
MKEAYKKVMEILSKPDMKILPGNIAFFMVLSIVPIILLIGAISSVISVPTTTLTNFMNGYFPKEVCDILIPYFSGQGINLNIIIFTIIGFFIASNGCHAIIISSNKLYGIPNSTYLKRKLKAFSMTILLICLIIFMLVFIGFGNKIASFLMENVFVNFKQVVYYIYLCIKWPIGISFIFFIIKLIYTIAPDKAIPSKYVNKGALFTTIFWLIATYIYGYYATNIANYTVFYGSLSSIIVLMLWIFIISYIFVVGITINKATYDN